MAGDKPVDGSDGLSRTHCPGSEHRSHGTARHGSVTGTVNLAREVRESRLQMFCSIFCLRLQSPPASPLTSGAETKRHLTSSFVPFFFASDFELREISGTETNAAHMPSPGNHCHNESDIRIGGSHTLCSLSKQTSGYPSDFGGGMTPEPRNQDLLPTVGGGGWSTPSLPPAGGMTPIVPNSTLGGGWSTPAGSFGGPGPTSQNLRLVSPKSTLDDVWSTPNPYPDTSGASDMTPESKCPDLSPVIPNPTLASEWSSLIHLLQIKEEERKRAENLLRSALAQLELEVETREILEAQVKELEERVERVQRDQGGLLGGDASKEMLAEQKGRVSEGAEVKGLKLKLSNTETEL